MRLWLGLALCAGPLAAQSARARLEGRVPGAAVPVVDSLVQRASGEGLPTAHRRALVPTELGIFCSFVGKRVWCTFVFVFVTSFYQAALLW